MNCIDWRPSSSTHLFLSVRVHDNSPSPVMMCCTSCENYVVALFSFFFPGVCTPPQWHHTKTWRPSIAIEKQNQCWNDAAAPLPGNPGDHRSKSMRSRKITWLISFKGCRSAISSHMGHCLYLLWARTNPKPRPVNPNCLSRAKMIVDENGAEAVIVTRAMNGSGGMGSGGGASRCMWRSPSISRLSTWRPTTEGKVFVVSFVAACCLLVRSIPELAALSLLTVDAYPSCDGALMISVSR